MRVLCQRLGRFTAMERKSRKRASWRYGRLCDRPPGTGGIFGQRTALEKRERDARVCAFAEAVRQSFRRGVSAAEEVSRPSVSARLSLGAGQGSIRSRTGPGAPGRCCPRRPRAARGRCAVRASARAGPRPGRGHRAAGRDGQTAREGTDRQHGSGRTASPRAPQHLPGHRSSTPAPHPAAPRLPARGVPAVPPCAEHPF